MKGVILAGGRGGRLWPATAVLNKHLIPILNRPMILFPLETLSKVFGIRDVLLVSGGNHIGAFAEFLGDGSDYGVNLTYRVQKEAGGIAQALGLARDFVGAEHCMVILGDNIFDNESLAREVRLPALNEARVFLKDIGADARRFGVAAFDEQGNIASIVEKPADPPSSHAVTGLYSFPPDVFDRIPALTPSGRGELEITDLNAGYLAQKRLAATHLTGFWSDAGTPESLAKVVAWAAAQYSTKA